MRFGTLRDNLPLTALGACFLALALVTQCTSQSDADSAEQGGGGSGGSDGELPIPSPRSIACKPNSSTVADDCPLPSSTCVNIGRLAYYSDPQCVRVSANGPSTRRRAAGVRTAVVLAPLQRARKGTVDLVADRTPVVEKDAGDAAEDLSKDASSEVLEDHSDASTLDGGQCTDGEPDVCGP